MTIATESPVSNKKVQHSPHFFAREPDGTVRLRVRFDGPEASLIEEAAGDTPLMIWLHAAVNKVAHDDVVKARRARPDVAPPD